MDDASQKTISLNDLVDRLSAKKPEPVKTAPPQPSPQPAPVASKASPVNPVPKPTGQPSQVQNAFRTMSDDLSKLKSGQAPVPQVDKPTTITPSTTPRPSAPINIPTPTPIAPVAPKPTAPIAPQPKAPAPIPTIPIAPIAPKPTPPPSPTPTPRVAPQPVVVAPKPTAPTIPVGPEITVPERQAKSRNPLLFIILLVLILAGGAYWYFNKKSDKVAVSPTPSASSSPTATPVPTLDSIFTGLGEPIELSTTGDVSADFQTKLNQINVSGGELKKLMVTTNEKGSIEFTPSTLMDRLLVGYPTELKNTFGEDSMIMVYGQQESFNSSGQLVPNAAVQKRIVLLQEIKDPVLFSSTMTGWESTMSSALASMFNLDKTKAAGTGFIGSVYQQISLRYRNFGYPDHTIDYALMTAKTGRTYWIMSNSRESLMSTIDKLSVSAVTPTPTASVTP